MDLWIGALNLGFLYAFMAIGTFITYKLYSFPDITIDGTFTTGAAVASILIVDGWNPFLVIPVAFSVGSLAGFVTGFIHTRFKIEGLLSGILVMTGLYSVNLHIMGKSNIPLMNSPTFVSIISASNPGFNPELWACIFLAMIIVVFWMLVSLFLRTDFGLTMRATGNNPVMIAAQGVSVGRMKIFGISLSNGFVGISGAMVAQYQGFADIGMGIGSIIFSLASVIIGEAVLRHRSMFVKILGVILGSIIFRFAVAFALYLGMNPNDLKIITAIFVLLTIITTHAISVKEGGAWIRFLRRNKWILRLVTIASVVGVITWIFIQVRSPFSAEEKKTKIGLILANQSSLLTNTRNGFYDELKKLGYIPGVNCEIDELNAEGDIPTNKTIVDHFLSENVDVFVSVSTASTQAVLNKVKDKPVVFATVANPFIIGAGKTESDHLPNVTGVYGTAPSMELLKIFVQLYPGKQKIGTIYNPAYPNTKVNLGDFLHALKSFPQIELEEVAVSGTSEVLQAAQSLASKNIKAFVLINDLTVFNSLESVVKVSRQRKIPIFTNDAERLNDGVLLVYGYEYYVSGMQAAHLVDRILKGESPASIPFEKYKIITYGVNYDVAKEFGISLPESIRKAAGASVINGKLIRPPLILPGDIRSSKTRRVALFQFSSNSLIERAVQGFKDQARKENLVNSAAVVFSEFNAHGDYSVGQAIAKNIVDKEYDYIVTFSTVALQIMANNNKKIPHVFCAVTDPVRAGVAKSATDHQPNLTGIATPQLVGATVELMKKLLPNARKVGIIWNTSEVNSQICTEKAREACKKQGFQLIERTITNLNDLDDAVNSITTAGIDIFFISGDVMISQVIPQLAKKMTEKNIPFFSNTADDIRSGTLVSLGADYYEVGEKAAEVFKKILGGIPPNDVPVETFVPAAFGINLGLAKKYRIPVPDALVKQAKIIIR
ncbi:MAG: ABC transporter substrate binding protein [bacterium]